MKAMKIKTEDLNKCELKIVKRIETFDGIGNSKIILTIENCNISSFELLAQDITNIIKSKGDKKDSSTDLYRNLYNDFLENLEKELYKARVLE